jgi:hypothetical protein
LSDMLLLLEVGGLVDTMDVMCVVLSSITYVDIGVWCRSVLAPCQNVGHFMLSF